ncbi:MAG: ribosomal protein S18-alanine N-acetyltransferase [Halobacteriota archaeon]
MFSIRRFQPSDFERVIGIEKEAFNEYNPILFMAAYETFPDGFLVVEKDGDVVGFLTTIATSMFDVKILSLAIDKRFQNKGFASMLMQHLFEVLRTKGVLKILLEVRLSNFLAQRLYLSLGFNLVKVINSYYQDGEDAYLMEKMLA